MHTPIRRILLADDDHDDVILFQDIIQDMQSPITITIAQDGMECIDILNNHDIPYDLFFLDINMPKADGFSCLKAIRLNKAYADIPVIMLSTASDPKTVESARRLGANQYITKSCDYSELKFSIQKAVRNFISE